MNQDLANLLAAYRQDPEDSLTHLALADHYDELGDRENALAHRWIGIYRPILFHGGAAHNKFGAYYYNLNHHHWYRGGAIPSGTLPVMIWDYLDELMEAIDSDYAHRSCHRSSKYASFTTKLRAYDALLETLRVLYGEYTSDLPRELQVVPCSQ